MLLKKFSGKTDKQTLSFIDNLHEVFCLSFIDVFIYLLNQKLFFHLKTLMNVKIT